MTRGEKVASVLVPITGGLVTSGLVRWFGVAGAAIGLAIAVVLGHEFGRWLERRVNDGD